MPIATHCKSIVGNEFLKPVFGYLHLSRFSWNCPALADSLWLEAGIRNETENKRKGKMLAKRDAQFKSNGRGGLTVLQQCILRLTQRTVNSSAG